MKKYLLIIFLSFFSILNIYAQCNATNDVLGNAGQKGLIGEYFAGYFNDVPGFFPNTISSTTKVESTLNYPANNWGVPMPPASGSVANQDLFSARYRGSINITTAGVYTFYLTSDDGSFMFLDNDALVYPAVITSAFINNSGAHASITISKSTYLSVGFHNIQILYGENTGSNDLIFEYAGPSIAKQVVPNASLCTGIQPPIGVPPGCICNDLLGNPPSLGLLGQYYANYFNDVQTFFSTNTPAINRIDNNVNFNTNGGWGNIVPPATGSVANPDMYSTRWTGSIYLPVGGTYTFYLTSDDASYLWLNDSAIVLNPTTATATVQNGGLHGGITVSASATLSAGLNDIKIHYGENAGNNMAVLEYANISLGITRQVVPNSILCSSFKIPKAPVVVSPLTYCLNATASALTATGTNLLWYAAATGGIGSSTATVPSTSAVGTISYYVSQTQRGCESPRAKIDVTVTNKPNLTITDPASVCAPGTVDLTAAAVTAGSTGGGTLTYWNDLAATSSLVTPAAVSTSNTYYIKSTITATGCFDIKPVVVSVNNGPVLNLTKSDICGILDTGVIRFNATVAGLNFDYSGGPVYTGSMPPSFDITVVGVNKISGLTSGTYTVRLQDLSGCYTDKTITINRNTDPVLVITDPAAVCAPATVDITLPADTMGSTGTGILSYWANAAATSLLATPTSVGKGTYYIKMTTASGCSDIKPIIATVDSKPNLVITNPAAVCSPVTVDLTDPADTLGSTGSGLLSYWNDLAATSVLAGPSGVAVSGTYYIKITTAGNCTDIKPIVATINSGANLVITDPPAVCAPATVDITNPADTVGSSGAGTLTYWTDAAATMSLAVPTAVSASGTYYIKANTAAGCTDIKPIVVTINAGPTLVITDPAPTCTTAVDLTAALVTAGSTGGGTLSYWTDAATTTTLASPNAVNVSNTYYIKSTAGMCYDVKPVVVSANNSPVLNLTNSDICGIPDTGVIRFTTTVAGLGYDYSGGITYTGSVPPSFGSSIVGVNSLTGLTSGPFTVRLQELVSGCYTDKIITITKYPNPNLVITDPSACSPSKVNLTAPAVTAGSTGGGTLTYWTDAAATVSLATPSSVGAGTYYIKSTTGAGCTDIKPVNVTINTKPGLVITDPASVCIPSTVDLTAPAVTAGSSGAGTLTYWTDAAATTTLVFPTIVSSSGTYYIKTTTPGGCLDIKPVTVAVNSNPILVITDPAPVCSPSVVNITSSAVTAGSSGGGTFSYWTDAAATVSLTTPAAVASTGVYYIESTTAGGCIDIKPVNVTVNISPSLMITDPVSVCNPGSIDITTPAVTAGSTGGGTLTYWTDAAATTILATPSAVSVSGAYYIKATTAANCIDIKPVNVNIVVAPNLVITDPAATCSTAVDITVPAVTAGSTGGGILSYWTDAAATVSLASPNIVNVNGTYYIESTVGGGCSVIKPVLVSANNIPVFTLSKSDICGAVNNGTLSITTATAGYAYDFTGGLTYSGPFTPLGFTVAGTVSIGSALSAGPYTARVVDPSTSCYADQTVTIGTAIIPILTLSSTDACEISSNGTISFTLSGNNYKYGYNSGMAYTGPKPPAVLGILGTNTINSLAAGNYTVYLEDTINGCGINQSITINTVLKPSNFTLTGGGSVCFGDTATILIGIQSSELGVSYQLQLAGANFGMPIAGTASALSFPGTNIPGAFNILAFVTSSPVCTTNINGTVNIISNPKPLIDSVVASCSGGAGVLKIYSTYASGTPEYSINGGVFQSANLFTNLGNASYTIVMRDNITHCGDTVLQNIYCNRPPVTGTDYNCVPAGVNASGNVTINDMDPDGNILKVNGQNFTTSHGGIFSLDTLGNYTYMPLAGFQGADTIQYIVCDNAIIPACSFGDLVLLVGKKRIVATYDTITTLENTAIASSISIFANDTVSIGNSIVFTAIQNNTTKGGGAISIDSLGNYTYAPALNFYGRDEFIYSIQDRCGNSDTASIYIEVKAVLPVFVPEGFSPGGAHSTFIIYNAERYKVDFKVYNRWGNLVYAKDDYKSPDWWNGTSNQGMSIGNILPDGTYFYTIDLNNGTKLPAGYIVIKR